MDWDLDAARRSARTRLLRRVARSAGGVLLAIGALVGLSVALRPVSAVLFAPWAIARPGGETLTGAWIGPLRSQWGSEYYLSMELGWEPPRGRTSRAKLTGMARVCNRAGHELRLAVSGDADRDAEDVRLDLEARDSRYRESLPLRGAWRGETLHMTAFTSPFGPEGALRGGRSTVSRSTTDRNGHFVAEYPADLAPDQVPGDSFPEVTLRKGGEAEYRAGCGSLAVPH
jgi:hypothetical protein